MEVEITVTGRKSGSKRSTPVWFVTEADRAVLLLPVKGSNTNWFRNLSETKKLTLSSDGSSLTREPKLIRDQKRVDDIAERFREKYGRSEIKKYYSKLDSAVEFPL